MTRSRLDVELVRRGLARSRATAVDLIERGDVSVGGHVAARASLAVDPDTSIEVRAVDEPWVGRAAYKLLGALEAFVPRGLRVEGRRCLDVGASTGGFTQVLLHHGAGLVVALDVGHDQLAPAVATHPRVIERSRTNIRDVTAEQLGGPFDLVVADLSFISLGLVLGTLAGLTAPDGDVVALVKPQFEVGRKHLSKGGIVRDHASRAAALSNILAIAQSVGLHPVDLIPSPLPGATGNREYLGWWSTRVGEDWSAAQIDKVVARMDLDT